MTNTHLFPQVHATELQRKCAFIIPFPYTREKPPESAEMYPSSVVYPCLRARTLLLWYQPHGLLLDTYFIYLNVSDISFSGAVLISAAARIVTAGDVSVMMRRTKGGGRQREIGKCGGCRDKGRDRYKLKGTYLVELSLGCLFQELHVLALQVFLAKRKEKKYIYIFIYTKIIHLRLCAWVC